MEEQEKKEKVYLITTKEISASFFEYYKLISQGDKLIANEDFWAFLTKKGCLFPVVWDKVMRSDKDSEAINSFKNIMRETRYDGMQEDALTYFDVVNVTENINETTIGGRDKYNIFINALVDCFTDNEKARTICEKIIGDIQQVEGTNIFVTHNWYSSSKIALGETYNDKLKYKFVELLIIHLKKKFNKDIDLHLIVHDKDLLNKGQTDRVLKMSDLPDIRSCVNLHDLVLNEKVYVFQHTVQNEFYPEILNAKKKQAIEDLVRTIDCFFKYRIPPTITNSDKYIEINISRESTLENRCCATREIIDAIAEFQSSGKFLLKHVLLEYNEYGAAITLMDNNKPVIVRGIKKLSELNDKRAFFLDSSIWLRYTTVADETYIIPNKYHGLYETANARETREFKARLCQNSYLQNFDGGHYKDVTPFLFHSETEMKQKAEVAITKLKGYIHNNVIPKWRFLLVDDNAFNSDEGATAKIQKCKVITDILRKDFGVVCMNKGKDAVECPDRKKWCAPCVSNNSNATIYIDCVRSIQDARKKLKERRYDVVLLDYLLGGETKREYGTDLLIELKKQYEDQIRNKTELPEEEFKTLKQYIKAKGPFGKFWIFFVSAFSNAISEKMLSEGMHYNTDYWYIARGACPTTTPELFRYNLYSLLYQQIKSITDLFVAKVGDDDSAIEKRVITLIDLLNHIFAEATLTRERAMKNFNSLLHLRAHYDILKQDYYMGGKDNPDAEKNGSPLVQALFPDIKHYSNAFWEHVQHLIYLIAFGNIRQWNEMWDEYIFIKDILRKAESEVKSKTDDMDSVVRKIEKHIIGIKNANYR